MTDHIVVIPAAGSGARFHELGRQYPKCLLPYGGRTILECLVSKIQRDLNPSQIRVVRRPEDEHHPIWDCVSTRVTFCQVQPEYIQGPATSLFSGIRTADLSSETRVTVVLSDMVLSGDFPLVRLLEYRDSLFVYSSVADPSRWCLSLEGNVFFDKPKEQVPGRALLGVYSFGQGARLRQALTQQLIFDTPQTEPQFSTCLSKYLKLTDRGKFAEIEVDSAQVTDLGTLEEYLHNRTGTAPRHFNAISYHETRVTKISLTHREKIRAEVLWLKDPPEAYRNCVPAVYDHNFEQGWYSMERVYGHNLRHLALYYDKSRSTWQVVFRQIWSILQKTREQLVEEEESPTFWTKVVRRVTDRTNNSLGTFYEDLQRALDRCPGTTPYHGDLHLSNMFWCVPGSYLKVVDPRGEYWGHWLYDVAKLCHSVLYRYDYIDEGLYTIGSDGSPTFYDRSDEEIRRVFNDEILANLTETESEAVRLLTAALFASMCPLHDNKEHCQLFLRTYKDIYQEKPLGELRVG